MNHFKLAGFVSAVALMAAVRSASAQDGPKVSAELVAAAAAASPAPTVGPFEASWESVEKNYKVPEWFRDAKFGIMMHWGVYAVPATGSEWYAKHMYGNPGITKGQIAKFGPLDKFGYKDFIPMFNAAKWDPDAWATLFKKAGAKYIIPTGIHHDGFALWDSKINPYNAKQMGAKRDLIGDLAVAVRKQGLKFGISHHGIEHFTFITPTAGLATDLNDPKWAGFYSVADRSDEAAKKFLTNWVIENYELIDQYQPDILWYDNGLNRRAFDAIKLRVAQKYYNDALKWGKAVSISTKSDAYLAGSIKDFERSSRAPKELVDFPWEVDDPLLRRFGYTTDPMTTKPGGVIRLLIECTTKNGNLLLNISPKADGTIPDEQQQLLLDVGKWLDVNGEAIYGTRPWKQQGDGKAIRFSTKGGALYAIHYGTPGESVTIPSVNTAAGKATGVTLLGSDGKLDFSQSDKGLTIKIAKKPAGDVACVFKIDGVLSK